MRHSSRETAQDGPLHDQLGAESDCCIGKARGAVLAKVLTQTVVLEARTDEFSTSGHLGTDGSNLAATLYRPARFDIWKLGCCFRLVMGGSTPATRGHVNHGGQHP